MMAKQDFTDADVGWIHQKLDELDRLKFDKAELLAALERVYANKDEWSPHTSSIWEETATLIAKHKKGGTDNGTQ